MGQHLFHRVGRQVIEHVAQGEGHAGSQGKVQSVVGGRGLELEVKGTADALPQRHAPGPVDGRAEGSVNHQLRTAAFVEKPLGHHPVGGGNHAQHPLSFDQIGHQLTRYLRRYPGFGDHPRRGVLRIVQEPVDAVPKLRDLVGEFPGAARSLAQPEGDGRQIALGVFDPDPSAFHPAHLPRSIAQQEDVAGHALDGEVLVYRADESPFRVGHHIVIRVVGNGPAAGQGGQAGAPASLHPVVDAVPVQMGAVTSLTGGESLGKGLHHLVEPVPGQVPVGIRAPAQLEQRILIPVLTRGGGHHLLRHHIQRPRRNYEGVQIAAQQCPGQRGALQHFVPG